MFKRPKADYQPQENLPNVDAFRKLAKEKKPNTSSLLDALANYIVDTLNALKKQLDQAIVNLLPGADDPANENKAVVSNGITWVFKKLTGINIEEGSITEREIKDGSVKKEKIDLQAVGTEQLEDEGVTRLKIKDGEIIASKVPDYGLPFSKFVKPQTASLIGGTTTNGGSWYELTLGNYQIATKKPLNNGTTAVVLDEVFNNTPGSNFDGGKIKPDSIDGSSAMKSNSTPLATLKSAGTSPSVICGRTTDQKFVEVTLGSLQVISKTTNGTSPSAMNLSTIFNNEGGEPYDGSQLTDGSVGKAKLANYQQFVPFCMGSVNADMSLNKSLNVQAITKNGTGLYRIAFTTAAGDTNYVCLPVVNDGSGTVARTSDKSTQAVVIRVTNMNGENVDAGFDFEIKSW